MPQDEINALPSHLQDLVNREVERRLRQVQDESELPLDALPIPQHIGEAPRCVSMSVRLYLRLCSNPTGSLVGWFFGGFGLMFALIAIGVMGLDDAIPRNWVDAGKGTITNVEETRIRVGGKRGRGGRVIYAYHFEMTNGGEEKISGISYGYGGRFKVGDEVFLENAGKRYRVQGLGLSPAGGGFGVLMFVGMGLLFGVIGLCFPIYSWFVGGKAIHLLRDGTVTGARFLGMVATNTSVGSKHNSKPIMKVNFEYQVDGERYTASAYALDTSRLTNDKYKTVLYDPIKPDKSVVLDGLPEGVRLDEMTGRFWVNPLCVVFPLLAATIVSGQIVAIVVFVIQAI